MKKYNLFFTFFVLYIISINFIFTYSVAALEKWNYQMIF